MNLQVVRNILVYHYLPKRAINKRICECITQLSCFSTLHGSKKTWQFGAKSFIPGDI